MSEKEMNLNAKRLRKFGKTIAGWLTRHTKFKKRKGIIFILLNKSGGFPLGFIIYLF